LFVFRSVKTLDERYIEAKKTFELGKAQLSRVEHRVFKKTYKLIYLLFVK
jgi:hypothetical protein